VRQHSILEKPGRFPWISLSIDERMIPFEGDLALIIPEEMETFSAHLREDSFLFVFMHKPRLRRTTRRRRHANIGEISTRF